MATDNVTPIRPPEPPAKPRVRRPKRAAVQRLAESGELEGFRTIDLVNGLHGVCAALDSGYFERNLEITGELSTAAKILASILQDRVIT